MIIGHSTCMRWLISWICCWSGCMRLKTIWLSISWAIIRVEGQCFVSNERSTHLNFPFELLMKSFPVCWHSAGPLFFSITTKYSLWYSSTLASRLLLSWFLCFCRFCYWNWQPKQMNEFPRTSSQQPLFSFFMKINPI